MKGFLLYLYTMKVLLTEEQYNLILEVSKVDVLTNKLGFTQKDAIALEQLTGGLSVWMGKKLVQKLYSVVNRRSNNTKYTPEQVRDEVTATLRGGSMTSFYRNYITSIMDWFRIGLNGNIKPYENLEFDDLYTESVKWHDSLDAGDGQINFVETNPIVLDFRDKDGFGYYWADLETRSCDKEKDRMGHCATSRGTLYSFRKNEKIPNSNFTKNSSFLTASIDNDGTLLQLKGPKNSKPNEKWFPYIVPLIMSDKITEFGSEYDSANDFSVGDLPEDQISKIYDEKPELFKNRKGKKILRKIGINLEPSKEDLYFTIDLDPSDIQYYVDGDWTVRKYKDSSGRDRKQGMFETLLSGDHWDLFEGSGEWESAIEYYTDDENNQIIWDLLKQITSPGIKIDEMSLKEAISEYDTNYEIRSALGNAMSSAESDSYYYYYIKNLRNALEEYGEVTKLNDEGATIKINLQDIINKVEPDEDDLDDMFERCDDGAECVFREMLGDYYNKPDFRVDDRWTPDIDERNFNSILNDYLADIRL